jgi:hypothetical protein
MHGTLTGFFFTSATFLFAPLYFANIVRSVASALGMKHWWSVQLDSDVPAANSQKSQSNEGANTGKKSGRKNANQRDEKKETAQPAQPTETEEEREKRRIQDEKAGFVTVGKKGKIQKKTSASKKSDDDAAEDKASRQVNQPQDQAEKQQPEQQKPAQAMNDEQQEQQEPAQQADQSDAQPDSTASDKTSENKPQTQTRTKGNQHIVRASAPNTTKHVHEASKTVTEEAPEGDDMGNKKKAGARGWETKAGRGWEKAESVL